MQLKRFFMILLVVILTVSAATIAVAADTGATLEMAVEVTASTAISDNPLAIQAGDIVTVRITLENNPGIWSLQTKLKYNTDAFTLVNEVDEQGYVTNAVTGDVFTSANGTDTCSAYGEYVSLFSALKNWKKDSTTKTGLVLELQFVANEGYAGKADFVLDMNSGDIGPAYSLNTTFDFAATNDSVLVHNIVVGETVAPTCTTAGYTKYICTGCDYSVTTDIVPATGHTPVAGEYKAPTCTEEGYTAGSHCSVCDAIIEEEKVIPPTGHTQNADASCTVDAVCTVCDALINKAPGHKPGAAATCTEAQTCTVCDTVLNPATGHKPGTAATCTDPQSCTACGEVLKPATGHTPGAAATCTKEQTCVVCGSVVAEKIPHSWTEWEIVKEATEEEEGLQTRSCSVCHEADEEVIPKLPKKHNYTAVVVDPTCTEKGYTEYTCTDCGDSYKDNYTDIIPHAYEKTVTAPTCVDKGFTTYLCSACGHEEIQDYVDATGHDHSGPAANCNAAKTCVTCGIVLEEMTVHAAAWDMVAKKDPTCVEAGYESYIYCNICNVYAKEKVEIPATGVHTPGAEATCTTAPTCTVCNAELTAAKGHTPGAEATCTTAQTCTVCNAELAAAKGHTPGAEATCTTAQTCTVCNAELAAAKGHTEAVDAAVAATCTTEGKTEGKHCSVCNEVLVAQETVPATGHTEGEWVTVTEPAVGVEGLRQKTCTVCGEVVASETIDALTPPETTVDTEPTTQEKDTTSGTKPEELVTDSETAGGDSDDGCFGIISGSAVLMSCIMIAGGAWICSSRKKKQD